MKTRFAIVSLVSLGFIAAQPQSSTIAGTIYKQAAPSVVSIEGLNDKAKVEWTGTGFIVAADGKVSGDYVVVRSHLTGTHKGPLLGIPATNKKIDTHGCNVVQLRNGKAVRSRLYADNATLFQQIGLLTLPKAMAANRDR
jgi:hypothetical protein